MLSASRFVPPFVQAAVLATLILLGAWHRVITLPGQYASWYSLWELAQGTFAIAALLVILASGTRRNGARGLFAAILLSAFLVCFWLVNMGVWALDRFVPGESLEDRLAEHSVQPMLALASLVLLFGAVLKRFHEPLMRWAGRALGLLWPLPLILAAQVAWAALSATATPQATSPFAEVPRQVVWIVFDELGMEGLEGQLGNLPAFRRLKETAFWASRARAPADHTRHSLPALLAGRMINDGRITPLGVRVKPAAGDDWVEDWLERQSLFRTPQGNARGIAITGWYLPYCRMFAAQAERGCTDMSLYQAPGPLTSIARWFIGESWFAAHLEHKYLMTLQPYLPAFYEAWPTLYWARRPQHQGIFADTSAALVRYVEAGTASLVFAHLNCPHLPALSPAPQGGTAGPEDDYRRNLAICDGLLAKVFERRPGGPTRRMFILTSDHGDRWKSVVEHKSLDYYAHEVGGVPFIVVLPDAAGPGMLYAREFNTLRTRELVEGFLSGQIDSYAGVRTAVDAWPQQRHRALTEAQR